MNYKYPDSRIIIFCKAPILGTVKTRMQPFLSEQASVELHKKLALETIELALNSQLCPVELWCAPDTSHAFFKNVSEFYPLTLHAQSGEDLGERMANAFRVRLEDAHSVILIGTDCPSFIDSDLGEALSSLQNKTDIVISPAEDGGYTLIGMREFIAPVFDDVDWGQPTVFEQTANNISVLDKGLEILDTQWDIDYPEDLKRYKKRLAEED